MSEPCWAAAPAALPHTLTKTGRVTAGQRGSGQVTAGQQRVTESQGGSGRIREGQGWSRRVRAGQGELASCVGASWSQLCWSRSCRASHRAGYDRSRRGPGSWANCGVSLPRHSPRWTSHTMSDRTDETLIKHRYSILLPPRHKLKIKRIISERQSCLQTNRTRDRFIA